VSGDRDPALVQYIRESIERIESYTHGGRDAFLREPMVQDAVLRRLETLADAASHLSSGVKARHPEIPWRAIYGFRNVAAHAYLSLDLTRVWQTVETHLPPLKRAIAAELGGPAAS
jgi:uncharacterized protein with HEPN domain